MCGIAGIINKNEKASKDVLQLMAPYLKSRGPDNTGFFFKENIGLLHTRLSIIDHSPEANQPMTIGSITVVLNGEIYNYKDLRKELIKENFSFLTSSDTEVVVLGYKAWGIDILLDKIDGMFAFAIFDGELMRTYVARDPFGKKPFYYLKNAKEFIFSSDIRAIWRLKKNNLTIDYESLDYYLTELSSPQPKTIWNEILQLEPGCYSEINNETLTIKFNRYWSIEITDKYSDISFQDALAQAESLIVAAILKRTVADVPVSCFLSGGVDSGLIVALLAQNSGSKINTFSVGFADESFSDELPYARALACKYGTNHHEILVEQNALELLPELIEYYGEPFADSSIIPSHYICKEMSKKYKVALSGDGGDELFGGYHNYGVSFRSDSFKLRYKNSKTRALITLAHKIYGRIVGLTENYGSYQYFLQQDGAGKLFRKMGFSFEDKKFLYSDSKIISPDFSQLYLNKIWSKNYDNLNDMKFRDTKSVLLSSLNSRLLNDYLVKVDRSSMKNSLEVRSPFLDKHLAKFAFNLPVDIIFKGHNDKYLLKKIAEKHVDKNIFERKKMGFSFPIKKELFRKNNRARVKEILLHGKISSSRIFNMPFVHNLLDEHNAYYKNNEQLVYSLLCLELWMNRYL